MIGAEKSKTIDEMVFYRRGGGGAGRWWALGRTGVLLGVQSDLAPLHCQLRRSNAIPIKRAEPV